MPRLGQAVRSTAGRDRGACFLVVQVLDQQFVAVADGQTRLAVRPKKKNVRHLEFLPYVHEPLAMRLARKERVTESELRAALAAFGFSEGRSSTGGQG